MNASYSKEENGNKITCVSSCAGPFTHYDIDQLTNKKYDNTLISSMDEYFNLKKYIFDKSYPDSKDYKYCNICFENESYTSRFWMGNIIHCLFIPKENYQLVLNILK